MFPNPFFHFSELYDDLTEILMCIDEELNISYISNAFRETFGFNVNNDTLAKAYISPKHRQTIVDAIKNQRSVSFEYRITEGSQPIKCIVIPSIFDKKKYATLFFIDFVENNNDQSQSNRFKRSILKAEREIARQTSEIINNIHRNTAPNFKELSQDPSFVSILKIRKEAELLAQLAKENGIYLQPAYIDINNNIKRVTDNIIEMLPKHRVIINLHLFHTLLIAQMQYETFDTLVTTAISAIIKTLKGTALIAIKTLFCQNKNMIIFGKDEKTCNEIVDMYIENALDCNYEVPVLSNLTKQVNGELYSYFDNDNRLFLMLTLPKTSIRADLLRDTSAHIPNKDDVFSAIALSLADVL